MREPRSIHFATPDDILRNVPIVAICGTPDVWHNWTPALPGVSCQKCRDRLFTTAETPQNDPTAG